MKLYRIRDWVKHFETHETRKLKRLSWVPFLNKHDGKGYRRVIRKGLDVFGAWVLIVEVASKCPDRGVLADEDGPLTAQDIADKTDAPVEQIQNALNVLTGREIGWLECSNPPESPGAPGSPGKDRGHLPDEGKGREGKEKEKPPSGVNPTSLLMSEFPLEIWEGAEKAGIRRSHILKYLKKDNPDHVLACLAAALRKGRNCPALFDALVRRDVKVSEQEPTEGDLGAAKELLRLHRAKGAQRAAKALAKDGPVGFREALTGEDRRLGKCR